MVAAVSELVLSGYGRVGDGERPAPRDLRVGGEVGKVGSVAKTAAVLIWDLWPAEELGGKQKWEQGSIS